MRQEDEELIASFLREEREAINTVEHWIAGAASPFRHRLGWQWEDVLQEIRLETTRLLGAGRFRGESGLRTYLSRVASHTCIDRLRAQTRRQWTELESLLDQASPDGESPLDLLLDKQTNQLMLRVLAAMPDECREMWGMILNKLSYQEMSKRLGVAEGALRVRVLRCRQKAAALREQLTQGKSESSM